MIPFLKQFAVLVTDLNSKQFFRARMRLTVFYTVIFGIFLMMFSAALYINFTQRIRINLDKDNVTELVQQLAIVDATDRLADSIKWIDLVSILLVGSLSYFVAGYTLEPLQKSARIKEQFMADASHELRTPLTIMRTSFEVYRRKPSPNLVEANRTIISAMEEVDRMERLVADLRTLSQIDSTRIPLITKPFDFSVALSRSCTSLAQYAQERDICVKVLRADTCPVLADPFQLEQACTNIIKNALDYSPSNSSITITLIAGSGATLTVDDKGIGIPENDLPHVFDRFYRVEQSRSRKTGGSGLGLAIAKEIVEAGGGSIRLNSIVDKGTVAIIRLPLLCHS
jgi:signal transduction histidine kinase